MKKANLFLQIITFIIISGFLFPSPPVTSLIHHVDRTESESDSSKESHGESYNARLPNATVCFQSKSCSLKRSFTQYYLTMYNFVVNVKIALYNNRTHNRTSFQIFSSIVLRI